MSDYDPPATVGIGTKLWVHSGDHAYGYSRELDSLDRYTSRWTQYEIVGETRVSWIARPVGTMTDYADKKIAKKTLALTSGYRLQWSLDGIAAEYADALWAQKNRVRIHDAVRALDVPTLRKVAALIGYEEAK